MSKPCCVCRCKHVHFENQNPYATGPGRIVSVTAKNCPVEGHRLPELPQAGITTVEPMTNTSGPSHTATGPSQAPFQSLTPET